MLLGCLISLIFPFMCNVTSSIILNFSLVYKFTSMSNKKMTSNSRTLIVFTLERTLWFINRLSRICKLNSQGFSYNNMSQQGTLIIIWVLMTLINIYLPFTGCRIRKSVVMFGSCISNGSRTHVHFPVPFIRCVLGTSTKFLLKVTF